jgi:hypothetical protein
MLISCVKSCFILQHLAYMRQLLTDCIFDRTFLESARCFEEAVRFSNLFLIHT